MAALAALRPAPALHTAGGQQRRAAAALRAPARGGARKPQRHGSLRCNSNTGSDIAVTNFQVCAGGRRCSPPPPCMRCPPPPPAWARCWRPGPAAQGQAPAAVRAAGGAPQLPATLSTAAPAWHALREGCWPAGGPHHTRPGACPAWPALRRRPSPAAPRSATVPAGPPAAAHTPDGCTPTSRTLLLGAAASMSNA